MFMSYSIIFNSNKDDYPMNLDLLTMAKKMIKFVDKNLSLFVEGGKIDLIKGIFSNKILKFHMEKIEESMFGES